MLVDKLVIVEHSGSVERRVASLRLTASGVAVLCPCVKHLPNDLYPLLSTDSTNLGD